MLDSLKVTVLAEDTVPYESPLLGQHGVSFWLEAERKGHVRRILVDVGQNPDALLYNINQLLELIWEEIRSPSGQALFLELVISLSRAYRHHEAATHAALCGWMAYGADVPQA